MKVAATFVVQVLSLPLVLACSAGGDAARQPLESDGGAVVTGGSGGGTGSGGMGPGTGGDSSSGGGGGMPAAPLTEAEACVRYVEGWCQHQVRCGRHGDLLTCLGTTGLSCPDLFFAEGSTRTVEGMISCGQTWKEWPCSVDAPPPCAESGTLAVGEPCIGTAQCDGWCSGGAPGGCGACVARVPLGSSCVSGDFCEVGARCSPERGTCEAIGTPAADPPPPGLGEPCPDGHCAGGLYCGYNADSVLECLSLPGAASRPGPGELCTRFEEPCADGFECLCFGDGCAEFRCTAVRLLGQPCGEPATLCHGAATCTGATCVVNVTPGAFEEACGP